jgi:hypothetical protein
MEINLKLNKEEALVLFEFLVKINKNENLFSNHAEQKVLEIMECILEKELEDIFSKDYKMILENAYKKINET